jgi:hypothetical protein
MGLPHDRPDGNEALDVADDKFVFYGAEGTGNIWMAKPKVR